MIAVASRLIDRLDALVPPTQAWLFGLRIWLAMMLALYAAFWLQLQSASSAAVCVAILAQPKRGQALSKAGYRFLGTIVGGVVAIAIMGAFNEDRVLIFVSFALWLGLCVFTAQYLQDTRAYGAMLSGYTVGIIALANLDTPASVFDAALGRVAAIAVGIVAITFINDALASPSTWRALRPRLAGAFGAVRAFAREAITTGDPGHERAAAMIGQVAPMRADASAIAGELDDGSNRAAGARSAIAALYVMTAASRGFAAAAARLRKPSGAVEEARRLCLRAVSGDVTEPGSEALDRDDARLRDLVDAALRDGDRSLDEIMALQRALDLHNAVTFAEDGLRALGDGHRPLRDVSLPTHRDFPVALRGALRVAIAFGIAAFLFVFAGLPQASFALVQISATAALSSVTPDPQKFAAGVLMGMPLAALFAGIILFAFLTGHQDFPLLAIVWAPFVFVSCFLSLNPKTFTVGFISLVFTPALMAPENPQVYNPQTFLMNAMLVVAAAILLFLTVRLVLPISASRHRAFALEEARRDTAEAMIGEGGDATTRTSLNSDRLFQFLAWNSGSGAVRRASLSHAFALARLEAAAARAHAQMRLLWRRDGLKAVVSRGREALASGNAWALEDAARDMIRAARALSDDVDAGSSKNSAAEQAPRDASRPKAVGRSSQPEEREIRLRVARAATDLATASQVIRGHGRFFRRLGLPSY